MSELPTFTVSRQSLWTVRCDLCGQYQQVTSESEAVRWRRAHTNMHTFAPSTNEGSEG